ncbi:protein containg helix-turn-helix domain [Longilinea arvoryzae]|uniref:Protein containg helix-turn-helix domain n=1 Tax=Longilinea arvoryzae TaxID=360412 RepID=A0A0S7BGE1_9CHLR|nr:helix-turn-helix domain-containing protein [Longilinea arvoryzae]GAP14100.1 protein containg helix-turn-helix domain [Longilinea arvoryzae]
MEKPIDLVLHPTRLRIIIALAGRKMTAQQLAEKLGDVPPATLYRHLNRLTAAGILDLAAERRVRGTLEKVYTLGRQGGFMNAQEFAALSREDHLRYFTTFVASLLDDFSRYIKRAEPLDPLNDGVGYQKFPLELSDEEFAEMVKGINAAIVPYLNNQPAPGRKRRIFATIVTPAEENKPSPDEPAQEIDQKDGNLKEE